MSAPNRIDIQFYPKQAELWELLEESKATNIGFGGAKGGGKSAGGRAVILLRALKYPGTRHLIFRRTSKELWGNHLDPLFKKHPFMRAWYNQERSELTVPTGKGKTPSTIVFGYAEHKGDIYKFQGQEFATQLRDEATQCPEDDHRFLDGCARYVGEHEELTPKVVYTMNPGGRGHAYIKRIFVDKSYEGEESADDYVFIQSYCWDNVGWAIHELKRDGVTPKQYYSWSHEKRFQYFITRTKYGRKLNSLPETDRLQYLMGDWDVFAGQFFSEFRRDLHVVRPFQVPNYWERFSASDWGYTSPACCLWFAVSPDDWMTMRYANGRTVMIPPRSVIVYRESYVRRKTTPQLAEEWLKLNGQDRLKYRLLDPAFGPTRGGGPSVAEEFNSHGWLVVDADNDRLQGWARVRQYLAWRRNQAGEMELHPRLYIFDTCQNLVRTLPQMIHDEKEPEDMDTEGEDHAVDALRYGMMSRPPLTLVPLELMDDDYAEAALRAKHDEEQR